MGIKPRSSSLIKCQDAAPEDAWRCFSHFRASLVHQGTAQPSRTLGPFTHCCRDGAWDPVLQQAPPPQGAKQGPQHRERPGCADTLGSPEPCVYVRVGVGC